MYCYASLCVVEFFFLMIRLPPRSTRTDTLFPYTTLVRSFALSDEQRMIQESARDFAMSEVLPIANEYDPERRDIPESLRAKLAEMGLDRKSTRLNSSH